MTGHGAQTDYVALSIVEPEAQEDAVDVDERLAAPPTRDDDAGDGTLERARNALNENAPVAALGLFAQGAQEAVIAGKPEDCQRVANSLACDYFEAALGDLIHCDLVRPDYDSLASLHVLDVKKNKQVTFFTAVGNKPLSISSQGVALLLSTGQIIDRILEERGDRT